jgi:hypothetical protein
MPSPPPARVRNVIVNVAISHYILPPKRIACAGVHGKSATSISGDGFLIVRAVEGFARRSQNWVRCIPGVLG